MFKKSFLCFTGFCLVVIGIALSIRDWAYIEMVFRGVIGPLMAVTGLAVLALVRD